MKSEQSSGWWNETTSGMTTWGGQLVGVGVGIGGKGGQLRGGHGVGEGQGFCLGGLVGGGQVGSLGQLNCSGQVILGQGKGGEQVCCSGQVRSGQGKGVVQICCWGQVSLGHVGGSGQWKVGSRQGGQLKQVAAVVVVAVVVVSGQVSLGHVGGSGQWKVGSRQGGQLKQVAAVVVVAVVVVAVVVVDDVVVNSFSLEKKTILFLLQLIIFVNSFPYKKKNNFVFASVDNIKLTLRWTKNCCKLLITNFNWITLKKWFALNKKSW